MHSVGYMRTSTLLLVTSLLGANAFAADATVNAAESRKPISAAIYNALGDETQQAELAAAYAIDLPTGELARVALLGTFGQNSVAIFPEGPVPPMQSAAISLFTNYDGKGAGFGDTSIQSSSSSPTLSVFSSFDADAKVTVVLLNKSAVASETVVLGFKGIGQKGDWRAFELSTDGVITPAGNGTLFDASLTRTVRPYSAVLIEYRPVGGILPIRTEPAADVVIAAGTEVEAPAATQSMGCSASGSTVEVGVLAVGLLALLGFIRRRSVN